MIEDKKDEIQALKAQVTSLREALEIVAGEESPECKGLSLIAQRALEMTAEQSLASIKARAIEEIDVVLLVARGLRHATVKGFKYQDMQDALNQAAFEVRNNG